MEDTLSVAKGQPVRHNAELVERAAALAAMAQRPPMPTDGARDLLGLTAGRP
jgi:3-keto-5-aminohexanoate cleavage enzyme